MKNLIKTVIIFLLLLTSCSKDEIINTTKTKRLIRITEKTTQSGNLISDKFVEYIYGSNGYVSKITASDYTQTYFYNSNNRIISLYSEWGNSATRTIEYTYNNDNLITTETYSTGSIVYYEYDTNNQLVGQTSTTNSNIITYEYDNQKTKMFIDSQLSMTFSYDNKINPLNVLRPMAYNKMKRIEEHNITKREHRCNYDYVFEYDSENYPTKSIRTDCNGRVLTSEYFYE